MNTTRRMVSWILTVLLALIFLLVGGAKLAGTRAMVQEFIQIGFGQWLRYVTGILEVSGAIGLLIPQYRLVAAMQIAIVMAGATYTNIAILHLPALAWLTALLMLLALALAWLRRTELSHRLKHVRG